MTGLGTGRPSPFSVCRQRPLSLVWCLAEIGDSSWGKDTEASRRGHTYTEKLLVAYLEFKLNWMSRTFSGSPAPEGSFVTSFVK